MKYSFIIPVYNRPDELGELLDSLKQQTETDFEVIVVDDGSTLKSQDAVAKHNGQLNTKYYYKTNSGPGSTRNFGANYAEGEYLIFLDSDVVLPVGYLTAVGKALSQESVDAFGGPDRANASFSPKQKAINYAMTSFFTTGGIRGGKKKIAHYYPRSFNMGIRRSVFAKIGGFANMRFGEDIDLSMRLEENGFKSRLFQDAWVWHKRRTNFRRFFRQVYNSGIARINLMKRHPGSLKPVHCLPTAFTICVALLLALFIIGFLLTVLGVGVVYTNTRPYTVTPLAHSYLGIEIMGLAVAPLFLYSILVLADSSAKNGSLRVGLLSVAAAFVELIGYGSGFLCAWWRRCVLRKDEFSAFSKTFYK